MKYTQKQWRKRIAERFDMSTSVVHLTREEEQEKSIDLLIKILKEKTLNGSTEDGFIVGSKPAVCFQDAPLHSVAQNLWYEQKYRKRHKTKIRYIASGLLFSKPYVYNKGGRPVFYEKKSTAKKILPEEDWWRIVNFDLSDPGRTIDWTHEREWRVPGNFEFDLNEATLLLARKSTYKNFLEKCKESGSELYRDVASIVVMSEILF